MIPLKLLNRVFNTAAFASLSAMIIIVTLQVYSRFFLEVTPHWTEEAARIFFVWAVAFGTGIGIRNGDFIRLDLAEKYLSPRANRVLELSTHLITLVFSLILMVQSWHFVRLGMDERSPALEVPMGFVFLSISITGLAIFVFTLDSLLRSFKKSK